MAQVKIVLRKTPTFVGLVCYVYAIIVLTQLILNSLGRIVAIPNWVPWVPSFIWALLFHWPPEFVTAAVIVALYEPIRNLLINSQIRHLHQKNQGDSN